MKEIPKLTDVRKSAKLSCRKNKSRQLFIGYLSLDLHVTLPIENSRANWENWRSMFFIVSRMRVILFRRVSNVASELNLIGNEFYHALPLNIKKGKAHLIFLRLSHHTYLGFFHLPYILVFLISCIFFVTFFAHFCACMADDQWYQQLDFSFWAIGGFIIPIIIEQ